MLKNDVYAHNFEAFITYRSVLKVKINHGLELSFKSTYVHPQNSKICQQKHLECKKVQGQSEATLQAGMCDQKL